MNNTLKTIYAFYGYLRYRSCLLRHRPYFGIYMAARQGDPRRHFYMNKVVKQKCQENKGAYALSILEIGSWAGASAIIWAEAIKKYNNGSGKVTCVDPWKSYLNLEKNRESIYSDMDHATQNDQIFKLFLHNIKTTRNDHIIIPLRGRSCDILPSIKNKRFDIIYIDGSHSYQDVLTDLRCSIKLMGDDDILCGDDLELQVQEIDLDYTHRNKDKDYVLDPNTKIFYHPGVTLAVGEIFLKKIPSWEGFWAIKKTGCQWEPVTLNLT